MSTEKNIIEALRWKKTTAYPNGLPDLTPAEAYLEEDAALCIELAAEIVVAVKEILPKSV
jgi:HEPN domain-containing protein